MILIWRWRSMIMKINMRTTMKIAGRCIYIYIYTYHIIYIYIYILLRRNLKP